MGEWGSGGGAREERLTVDQRRTEGGRANRREEWRVTYVKQRRGRGEERSEDGSLCSCPH